MLGLAEIGLRGGVSALLCWVLASARDADVLEVAGSGERTPAPVPR